MGYKEDKQFILKSIFVQIQFTGVQQLINMPQPLNKEISDSREPKLIKGIKWICKNDHDVNFAR